MSEQSDGGETDLLVVESLSKSYNATRAVSAVGFRVARGETVAFLGPNGAGKSTTMRMIAGYLDPDEGGVWVNGLSVQSNRVRTQAGLGYLAEGAPLYPDLSAQAYLSFLARAHGLHGTHARDSIERVAKDAGVTEVLDRRIETLSKGYRRRVALAGAMVHDPDVLVLDEPTDGLDPNQKQAMRDWLAELRPHKAILISTHQLDEVEAMCPRAIVIAKGEIMADGPTRELLGDNSAEAFARLTNGSRVEVEGVPPHDGSTQVPA